MKNKVSINEIQNVLSEFPINEIRATNKRNLFILNDGKKQVKIWSDLSYEDFIKEHQLKKKNK